MGRWPIRWRLTAWYAAAMSLILATVGSAIYIGLHNQLHDELNERLSSRERALSTGARSVEGRPTLDEALVAGGDDDEMIRLWTTDGDVVADSWRAAGGGLTAEEVRELLRRVTEDGTLRIDEVEVGGEPFRRSVVALADDGGIYGVLEVAHSREDLDETLRALRYLFLVATPIGLALALAGGSFVAGRALKPVGTITSLAHRVSGTDLSARLNLDLPDDELGRLAGTFDAMLDRVADAFERQRRFTGDAAHELRTPLSLIRTRVDLALARERPGEEYRQTLVELDRDVARLSGLVGTLLTLARSDAGTLPLDRQPTDLRATIQAVVEQYHEGVTGLVVVLDAPPIPVVAMVDEDLIIQLLVNLIDNAVAHTRSGGTVTVGCSASADAVSLWVADTGVGITADHLDRLFDRFYRVDAGRTAAAGGVGLGLSICKTIVEAHGGVIRIDSAADQGTRVDITLPAGP